MKATPLVSSWRLPALLYNAVKWLISWTHYRKIFELDTKVHYICERVLFTDFKATLKTWEQLLASSLFKASLKQSMKLPGICAGNEKYFLVSSKSIWRNKD